MLWKFPLKVQAYDSQTDSWFDRIFETKANLLEYIENQFSVPGEYHLRNTAKWQETGRHYAQSVTKPNFEGGRYHNYIRGSVKEKNWRQTEKERVLNGVIYDGWYVPPFYYWYLNYCPIYDDLEKKKKFANVWDGDFWYMQYVMRCILRGKHVGGVKGRQKGYSYKHMAILYWAYCWFENSVNTVGAYDEKLVRKSWRFLEGYRAHINRYTAWFRGPTIPKSLEWHESQLDETNQPQGLQSKLVGVTFKMTAENDVGGSQTFFNYEEPGVSPTILRTLEYIKPAMIKGTETTGIIIACGSVGELDDAEGLKSIFYDPEAYGFLGLKNIWDDDAADNAKCCIFISEAYNMIGTDDVTGKPFMDKDGNSDVPLAMAWIARNEEKIRNSTMKADLKQLALSQKCTSPKQAFDQRTVSEWPVVKMRRQQERIKVKEKENLWEIKPSKGLLEEDGNGRVILNTSRIHPELPHPIKAEFEDKHGVAIIWEPPAENAPMYTYFAGVDPVEVDETDTSDSVASIDIFKTAVRVKYTDEHGVDKFKIEGDKPVFSWRGRFPTAEETNEHMWLAIKMYNAFAYVERNKPNFINYMKRIGKAEIYLAKEGDVPVFKDLNVKNGNSMNNSKYGFHKGDNTEIWKHLKAIGKEYFQTEYGRHSYEKNGKEEILKVVTGIDKIDDYWLLEEFIHHTENKGNYDRMISFLAALFLAKTYQANGFMKTIDQTKKKETEQPKPPRVISMLGGAFGGNLLGNSKRRRGQSLL